MTLDLTDEETAALLAELDRIIDGDRYPFSPRIRTLKEIREQGPAAAGAGAAAAAVTPVRAAGEATSPRVKAEPGPPMTLGGAAAAGVRIIVWCEACRHQVEPDPAELAERYGAGVSVPDWRDRLVCSRCGSREVDMVLTGQRR
jgi:hypothetical protein